MRKTIKSVERLSGSKGFFKASRQDWAGQALPGIGTLQLTSGYPRMA